MGFWSGTGKVLGQVFDVRVDKWFGAEKVKRDLSNIQDFAKSIFTIEQAARTETFEEAMVRLQLTDAIIEQRRRQYSILVYSFLFVALLIFAYGVYLACEHNWSGFLLAIALTLYSLSQAFRYDFWVFQFTKRKLGCTLKEWWSS